MTHWLNRFSPAFLKTVKAIGQQAQRRGLKAYVVGGIVRDLILKKKNLDLDVVVEGNAIAFARALTSKYKALLVVHEKFGTATLTFPSRLRLDLATAREEYYPSPAALPVVDPGTIRDDLFRRDFTINAMAICINPDDFGRLVDYYGGWEDLCHKRIRVLHKESFLEDPTRILRAVRFEQRLGFQLEAETGSLLKSALQAGAEHKVKPARYFQEFRKNFKEARPWKNIRRLYQLGGLKFLGKGVKSDRSLERLMRSVDEQRAWHQRKFKGQNLQAWLVQCMALLYAAPHALRRQAITKFHLSNYEKDNILILRKVKNIIKKLSRRSVRPSEVVELLRPWKREAILFVRALSRLPAVRSRIGEYWIKGENARLSINGHDLSRLGLQDGRAVGKALKKLLAKKIDGEIISRQDEFALAQEMISRERKRRRS